LKLHLRAWRANLVLSILGESLVVIGSSMD
jgi:hypothetical protein